MTHLAQSEQAAALVMLQTEALTRRATCKGFNALVDGAHGPDVKLAGQVAGEDEKTLDLTLSGIAEKPGVIDGRIAMTLSFDHTMIDGAPAARFAMRLKELIESGYGLCESEAEAVGSQAG